MAAIVIRHVREAGREEAARPLLDAEDGRQLLVVHLRPEGDELRADEPVLAVEESASAIGPAKIQPVTRPNVAMPIVNQKLVRRTVRRFAEFQRVEPKRKNALEMPPRRIVTSTALSAIRTPTALRSSGR